MKTCKNCVYSRKIIPKNTNCPSEFVCSLSDEDFHNCISDDMSHFSSKVLDQSLKDDTLQGEWVYGEDDCGQDGWFCSKCGFFVPWYYQYYEKDVDFIRDYKVCPHCVSEMITYTGKDSDTKGGAE